MELTVERNGRKVGEFAADVDTGRDFAPRMAALLEGWLAGRHYDRDLWPQFSLVGMHRGTTRIEVLADGRQP